MAKRVTKTTKPASRKKSSRRTRAATAAKRPVVKAEPAAPVAKPVQPPPPGKFPNSWQLFARTVRFWWQHGRVTAIYLLVLAVVSLLLVHNFGTDVGTLKSQVQQVINNGPVGNLATYVLFVGSSSGSAQGSAAIYQYVLLIIVSLSTIWLLRQLLSDKPPARLRVRDAFYQGMYPLVPYVLVLLVLSLELIPLIIGSFLYATVVQNGIAIGPLQNLLWLVIFLLLATLSVWLLAGTLFAGYIATLPNMTPVLALRNSRKLTRGHRLNVIRKLLNFILIALLVSAVVLVPALAMLPALAGLLLFVLGVLALPAIHGYFYMMYRELLHE